LAERETLEVLMHVGEAVALCHEQGVVHRDVKPENILLSRPVLFSPAPSAAAAPAPAAPASPAARSAPVSSPAVSARLEAGAVRLADFGLAAVVADKQRGCSAPAGTPGYLAPEVLALCCPPSAHAAAAPRQGKPPPARTAAAAGYGCAADVWSPGVTLYEMIAGERPYSGDAPQDESWRAPVEGPAWEGVSEECRAVVNGMLRVRAAERLTMAQGANCQQHGCMEGGVDGKERVTALRLHVSALSF
ncbi:hypothetical protein CLOM_g12105, partial [Closterium sp. NIES-68]